MLKQNINQDVFVSMIRSKLPEDVMLQLEMLNGAKNKWTVENLRIRLHEYVTAREHAEKEDEATSRRANGDNNSRCDRGPKTGTGAYSGNRRHQTTGGQKLFGSYTNVNKSDYREWSGRQGSIGSAEA